MFAKRNSNLFDYVACHYGREITTEMVELLGSAGYLDNNVKFVNDIQYAGKSGNHFKLVVKFSTTKQVKQFCFQKKIQKYHQLNLLAFEGCQLLLL